MTIKQSNWLGKISVGLGVGLVVSMAITVLGAAIGAWLISSGKIGENWFCYAVLISLILSSMLGSSCVIHIAGKNRVMMCLLAAGQYFLSLLAINVLFLGGTYSGVGESALVIIAGALSVVLFGLRGNKRSNRKKKK